MRLRGKETLNLDWQVNVDRYWEFMTWAKQKPYLLFHTWTEQCAGERVNTTIIHGMYFIRSAMYGLYCLDSYPDT